jgi:hypothetical protein
MVALTWFTCIVLLPLIALPLVRVSIADVSTMRLLSAVHRCTHARCCCCWCCYLSLLMSRPVLSVTAAIALCRSLYKDRRCRERQFHSASSMLHDRVIKISTHSLQSVETRVMQANLLLPLNDYILLAPKTTNSACSNKGMLHTRKMKKKSQFFGDTPRDAVRSRAPACPVPGTHTQ